MNTKMECSISDGPDTPEEQARWEEKYLPEDEDEAYERSRQEEIDAKIAPKEPGAQQ